MQISFEFWDKLLLYCRIDFYVQDRGFEAFIYF